MLIRGPAGSGGGERKYEIRFSEYAVFAYHPVTTELDLLEDTYRYGSEVRLKLQNRTLSSFTRTTTPDRTLF